MHNCVYDLKLTEKTLNLAQATATYDAATASGDCLITGVCFYVSTIAAGGFTSVSVQTNQTTALILMTAAEGAAANLLAQSHPSAVSNGFISPWTLRSGQKVQYSIVSGALPTGEMKMILTYRPITAGGSL